ncbi:MFS transporter [Tepidibacillus marianensis]|uniref:MFS transporter n=1 Tax=Tepidibacillus marianensis TaxID=3131995 RepID=UPI003869AA9A
MVFKTHRFELFVGMIFTSLLTLLLIEKWMTEEFIPVVKSEKVNVFKDLVESYKVVVKDKKFMIFSIASILVLALEFQRNNFVAVRLEKEFPTKLLSFFGNWELKIDGIRMLSLLTTENTLIIVLFTIMIANWIKHKKELPLLYLGALIQAVGFGVMSFHNMVTILFIASFVQTIGEMIYVPVHQTIMADIIDDQARGAYMAINGLVFQGAKMLGALGLILGSVVGGMGMAIIYLLIALLSILLFKIALQPKSSIKKEQSFEG